jgi:hypothetical protein
MILKSAISVSICVALFFCVQLHAQKGSENPIRDTQNFEIKTDSLQNQSYFDFKPTTSAFVELLGKGFLSLNVDFRRKQSYAISIGLQPTEGLMPDIMYYHFSGTRYRFELGGGFSTGFNKEIELAGVLIHGVIGYRYQKKKGLLFRAGFTPLYVIFIKDKNGRSNKLYPFVGLSLGYSF